MTSAAKPRLPIWIVAVALIATAGWIVWLAQLHLSGRASALDRAEASLTDLRLQWSGPRAASAEVAIVAIDDATIEAAGRYPLDRGTLARLIRAIGEHGAKSLAIDLLLVDAGDAEGDAALVEALRTVPTVIAAAGQFPQGPLAATAVPRPASLLSPRREFAAAAQIGLVNVVTDDGGTPRHVPMLYLTPSGPLPSLVLRAVGVFLGDEAKLSSDALTMAGRTRPLDLAWHLPIRFLGPRGTVATVSAADLLDPSGGQADLRGKLVFLGATGTGVGDRFATPFDPVLPGVEVLATAASNLLDGGALVRDPGVRRTDVAAAAGLAVTGAILVVFAPLVAGLALFAGLVIAWLAATGAFLGQGIWFGAALPLAVSLPPVVLLATARELFDRRQARRVASSQRELSRLQAPALARRIALDPDFLREPLEQSLAILFVDLAGFTGLSESLGHVETRRVLKSFHTVVVEAADAHGGVVLTFMGDGAMIVHGVPDSRPDDAANALKLAFALVDGTERWIAANGLRDWVAGARAGVHFGPVIVSRLGHDNHQHITVTGDSVNVASRLMDVAKDRGAAIAASSTALQEAGDPAMLGLSPPGTTLAVEIRGRREPLDVVLWRQADRPASPFP